MTGKFDFFPKTILFLQQDKNQRTGLKGAELHINFSNFVVIYHNGQLSNNTKNSK